MLIISLKGPKTLLGKCIFHQIVIWNIQAHSGMVSGTVSVNSVGAEELQGQGKLGLQRQILLQKKKKRREYGEIEIKVNQVQLVYWKGKGTVKGNKKIRLLHGGEVTLKYYQKLYALRQ